jgi:hypothetical protein
MATMNPFQSENDAHFVYAMAFVILVGLLVSRRSQQGTKMESMEYSSWLLADIWKKKNFFQNAKDVEIYRHVIFGNEVTMNMFYICRGFLCICSSLKNKDHRSGKLKATGGHAR